VRPSGWVAQSILIHGWPPLWLGHKFAARFLENFIRTRLLHLPQLLDQRQAFIRILLRHRIDKQLQPSVG
jgi:hypothetical protein